MNCFQQLQENFLVFEELMKHVYDLQMCTEQWGDTQWPADHWISTVLENEQNEWGWLFGTDTHDVSKYNFLQPINKVWLH